MCDRSFEKEKNLPKKKDFYCYKLYSDYIDKYPNNKIKLSESTKGLAPNGKRIMTKFIKKFQKKEEQYHLKDKMLFELCHSKLPVELNSWKVGRLIPRELNNVPLDLVYSFNKIIPPKPSYMANPFRRPKDKGNYFSLVL